MAHTLLWTLKHKETGEVEAIDHDRLVRLLAPFGEMSGPVERLAHGEEIDVPFFWIRQAYHREACPS